MSEKLQHHIESDPAQPEHPPQHHESHKPAHEKQEKAKAETLDAGKIRERIEDEIHKADTHSEANRAEDSGVVMPRIEKAGEVLADKLQKVRHRLTPNEKRFSKVIHNHTVSAVSEATAKTVARPYAVLAGGIFACVGSAIYMYYTRHLGYKYNYFVPILLFGAGLAVGLVVELILKTVNRGKKRSG